MIPLGADPSTALRVLLLEDSRPYRELVHLLPEGFDVVLADQSLPDAEDVDVVLALHDASRDVALVVLTGTADGSGASLHTIAAALNREGAPNPTGVRWHSHAVARHVTGALDVADWDDEPRTA